MSTPVARLRRTVALASAGVAVFVAAPMFYWLGSIATRKRPSYAEHVAGTWEGRTPEGDIVKLRFNNRGVAAIDSPANTARGPVNFTKDSFAIEPIIPVFGGAEVRCVVSHWPASPAQDETLVVDGVELRKPADE